MTSRPQQLAIGEVAELAGVATSTLRYYEREALLPAPARASGRRRYDRTVLQRLAVIDVAKRAGFSLDEIRHLLEGFDEASETLPSSTRWRDMAAAKLPEIEAVIADAQRMRRLLTEGIASVRLPGRPWGYPSPYAYRRGPGLTMTTLVFDTLVWRLPSGELRPWLAQTWDVSPDGLEHRFVLRDDVRWHDGERLTADDVAFTLGYRTAESAPGADLIQFHGIEAIASVATPDRRTVAIRLHEPYAAFGDFVAGRIPIVPAHVWRGVADPATLRGPDAVIGSGPYRLDSCDERAGHYGFHANDDYFLGAPYLRSVTFTPVPDQLEALEQGLIDAIVLVGDVRRPSTAQLAGFDDPRYRVEPHPGEWTRALHFDLGHGSPFADRRVRHAVAHALDRDRMVTRLLSGRGRPASLGGLAPTHPETPADLPRYAYDVDTAQALLDAAGFPLPAGEAVRRRPDGTPLVVGLLTEASDPGAARLVQRDLERVGIEVRVTVWPDAEVDASFADPRHDLVLAGYGALGGDPDVLRLRLSSQVSRRGRTRAHGYHNPRFEELARAQAAAMDPATRSTIVAALQQVVATDLPTIPLYVPDRVTIAPVKQIFTAWEPTKGGVWGGYPGPLNKHTFITGSNPA